MWIVGSEESEIAQEDVFESEVDEKDVDAMGP